MSGRFADIELRLKDGPNRAPTFTRILNFDKSYISQLGFKFGDVVVVQEHRSRRKPREYGEPL